MLISHFLDSFKVKDKFLVFKAQAHVLGSGLILRLFEAWAQVFLGSNKCSYCHYNYVSMFWVPGGRKVLPVRALHCGHQDGLPWCHLVVGANLKKMGLKLNIEELQIISKVESSKWTCIEKNKLYFNCYQLPGRTGFWTGVLESLCLVIKTSSREPFSSFSV